MNQPAFPVKGNGCDRQACLCTGRCQRNTGEPPSLFFPEFYWKRQTEQRIKEMKDVRPMKEGWDDIKNEGVGYV